MGPVRHSNVLRSTQERPHHSTCGYRLIYPNKGGSVTTLFKGEAHISLRPPPLLEPETHRQPLQPQKRPIDRKKPHKQPPLDTFISPPWTLDMPSPLSNSQKAPSTNPGASISGRSARAPVACGGWAGDPSVRTWQRLGLGFGV